MANEGGGRRQNIEYELDAAANRTGRWRAHQYYAQRAPDGRWARLPPSALKACEWRGTVSHPKRPSP